MNFINTKGKAETFKASLGDTISYFNPSTLQDEKGIVHAIDADGYYSVIPLTAPKVNVHNDVVKAVQPSTMSSKVYSVIVTHEAEVFNTCVFTDYDKAKAKVESIKAEWDKKYGNHKGYQTKPIGSEMNESIIKSFGYQYASSFGYHYDNGRFEYGDVVLMETAIE